MIFNHISILYDILININNINDISFPYIPKLSHPDIINISNNDYFDKFYKDIDIKYIKKYNFKHVFEIIYDNTLKSSNILFRPIIMDGYIKKDSLYILLYKYFIFKKEWDKVHILLEDKFNHNIYIMEMYHDLIFESFRDEYICYKAINFFYNNYYYKLSSKNIFFSKLLYELYDKNITYSPQIMFSLFKYIIPKHEFKTCLLISLKFNDEYTLLYMIKNIIDPFNDYIVVDMEDNYWEVYSKLESYNDLKLFYFLFCHISDKLLEKMLSFYNNWVEKTDIKIWNINIMYLLKNDKRYRVKLLIDKIPNIDHVFNNKSLYYIFSTYNYVSISYIIDNLVQDINERFNDELQNKILISRSNYGLFPCLSVFNLLKEKGFRFRIRKNGTDELNTDIINVFILCIKERNRYLFEEYMYITIDFHIMIRNILIFDKMNKNDIEYLLYIMIGKNINVPSKIISKLYIKYKTKSFIKLYRIINKINKQLN